MRIGWLEVRGINENVRITGGFHHDSTNATYGTKGAVSLGTEKVIDFNAYFSFANTGTIGGFKLKQGFLGYTDIKVTDGTKLRSGLGYYLEGNGVQGAVTVSQSIDAISGLGSPKVAMDVWLTGQDYNGLRASIGANGAFTGAGPAKFSALGFLQTRSGVFGAGAGVLYENNEVLYGVQFNVNPRKLFGSGR